MPKLTTTDLTSLSSNETSSVSTINANFALVETAIENTLSRDGTATNTMTASLDMNSNKILNVASGTAAADGVNLSQLTAATGQVPGLSMTMETTTTDADQGVGKVWFNAAVASATVLYMDDVDTNSANIATFVQTWDNSTSTASRGYIYVIQKASAVNYAIFEIDGAVTDDSGYTKIPVNYMIGAGTLADADPVTVNFIRTGDKGATGSTGATGSGEGIEMAFESTTTDTDQGAGKVWLNNGTASSATVVYMDDVDSNAANINSFIDSFDDSGSSVKGRISIKKQLAPENYHIYNVTGSVTSASTYSKIACTHIVSVGTISDADAVHVSFSRTGDKGDTGATGSGDMSDVIDDTSPQLGGDLDCNGSDITSASNADVDINPNGTGNVVLKTDLVSVGGGSEVGHVSSNGTQDLKLSTNSVTNSGTIIITDGVNEAITLAPNGTGIVDVQGSMNSSISTTGKAIVFGF